jgi:uncharacterized protein YuzB (UPF0349 family)
MCQPQLTVTKARFYVLNSFCVFVYNAIAWCLYSSDQITLLVVGEGIKAEHCACTTENLYPFVKKPTQSLKL